MLTPKPYSQRRYSRSWKITCSVCPLSIWNEKGAKNPWSTTLQGWWFSSHHQFVWDRSLGILLLLGIRIKASQKSSRKKKCLKWLLRKTNKQTQTSKQTKPNQPTKTSHTHLDKSSYKHFFRLCQWSGRNVEVKLFSK